MTGPREVRLAAMGDLMLVGEWAGFFQEDGRLGPLAPIRAVLDEHDLVFANLETTVQSAAGCIPKQPRVIASGTVVANALEALRVSVANVANNHAFDSYLDGFQNTVSVLNAANVRYFGAGESLEHAARPCIIDCNGIRIGWLGFADLDTRPSHVAGPGSYGVNPLREPIAVSAVARLARDVHHVIVSLHWGVEFCHVPAPDHIRFARRLVDEGATLVIGHHAHVVQGLERWHRGAIAYNLGNLTTSDFTIDGRLAIRQSRRTTSSVVLSARLTETSLEAVQAVPVRGDGRRLLVGDAWAGRYLARANRRLASVSPLTWRLRRVYEDVCLRTVWKLDPRVIRSIRGHHAGKVVRNLSLALRGQGPA